MLPAILLMLLPVAIAQVEPNTAALFRINCGASGFTDSSGRVWAADNFFLNTGTRTFTDTTTSAITNINNADAGTTSQTLYKTERWGPIQYAFPGLTSGSYIVHLHFAEVYPPTFMVGARQFRVTVEGQDPFGVIDLAGDPGARTAVVKAVTVSVTDGTLNINFQQIRENPKISGIVVFRAPTVPSTGPPVFVSTPPTAQALLNRAWTYPILASGTLSIVTGPSAGQVSLAGGTLSFTPVLSQAGSSQAFTIRATNGEGSTDQSFNVLVDTAFYRVNCGGPLVEESSGVQWLADGPFVNTGTAWSDSAAIINRAADPTIPNTILQTHRWDPTTTPEMMFSFPLPSGAYDVDLIMAEVWPGAQTAGIRRFHVAIEGQRVMSDFDITAAAGFRNLVIRTFAQQVTDGVLNIQFLHSLENPAICAIRVRPGGCPAGQTMCAGVCRCGTLCSGPICAANQVCSNGQCVAPPACAAPFQMENGVCVYPRTGGTCPRDEVDCLKGCASAATTANPFTICQGGQCRNGVCVKNQLSAADVTSLTTAITTFFNARSAEEQTLATNPNSGIRVGDFVGGLARAMFHDPGAGRAAHGCLWVRDVNTNTCNGRACEFTAVHNRGMEETVIEWHDFYVSGKLSNGNTIISTITLQDFVYLAGRVALKIASGNNAQLNINYRWGRQACNCLELRPFSACANPPSFPNSMPEPEEPFTVLADTMENKMGFTRREWYCLLGAHTLGRCEAKNSGYARSWVETPNRFNNQYFLDILAIVWDREPGTQSASNPTNPDQVVQGHSQFMAHGAAPNTGTIMLDVDMATFWLTDGSNCNVTHTGAGCPQRLQNREFNTLLDMQDLRTFYECFAPAFQKMTEMGNTGLQLPA